MYLRTPGLNTRFETASDNAEVVQGLAAVIAFSASLLYLPGSQKAIKSLPHIHRSSQKALFSIAHFVYSRSGDCGATWTVS